MPTVVPRHKTAITRNDLSRPIRFAIADGIIARDRSIFDYGCGLGDDIKLLAALGHKTAGWDPIHQPLVPLLSAAVVNLGYVVNVIENSRERQEALRTAWKLAEQVLVVSARLHMDARALSAAQDFADGYLTSRGTFQKFFDQMELRNWIDSTIGVSSVPAAPGIYYVFRDEQERTSFIASRYRRRLAAPRLTRSAELFEQHEVLLRPLIDFVTQRGRVPADEELTESGALRDAVGSVRRAFQIIKSVTGTGQWEQIAKQRANDLLIYLALARFDGRPIFSRLPRALQRDVKGFFSHYKQACTQADEVLFSLGEPGLIETACQISPLGKLTPSALYVHESALEQLSPILRIFEGCARGYIGRVDGANIIKLHRQEPKVSYLGYPDFEADPHPALAFSLTIQLQTFRVKSQDYTPRRNPPILHRKETFVARDHPLYEKFARLTRIEEQRNLYNDTSRIGTRDGWYDLLATRGLRLKGHRLVSA